MELLDEVIQINFLNRTDILIKLGLTALLGLIIGFEREMKGKPVGLKTSLVISIVSCLLTIVSIEAAYISKNSEHINITMDPLRLAAQIVSGVGFLGAGVILRRENDSISGLTTAAMIWGAAGIGVVVGAGFYTAAITGVILIIFSVEIVPLIMNYIGPKQFRQKELLLQLVVVEKTKLKEIIKCIKDKKISIKNITIEDVNENSLLVQLNISVFYKQQTVDVYDSISNITGIKSIKIENL